MASAAVCVIYNPISGKGRGARRLDRLRRALDGRVEFWPTLGPGAGTALARQASVAGFATVGAAGGDGTVHEVANGILSAGRPEVALAVLPLGSANDYAHSLGLDADWWRRPDPRIGCVPVDVGVVRSGERSRWFVNGLGLGFNGAVTLESRRIRRLQGVALYGLATLRALWLHFDAPRMAVCIDDGVEKYGPTLALSLALGRREGNFVVAPAALLDDGLFDYFHAGRLRRRDLVGLLPGLLLRGGLPTHPALRTGRCRRVVVRSEAALTVHTDGEFFSRPEDGVHELSVELHPRALRVFRRFAVQSSGPRHSSLQ